MYETLVLDLGNSRLKWGLHGNRGWMGFGATPNSEIGTLALRDWQNLPRPMRVIGVNVAGEAPRVRLEAQIARWRLVPQWITAAAEGAGVVNGYKVPSQLGADRWASLVAARQRATSTDVNAAPAVVINAGTAVTIDALDEGGRFLGGLIVPGVRVMLRSLAENTAALRVPSGGFSEFPDNTPDALYSGAVHAIIGAIELMRMRLERDGQIPTVYLAGGAAPELAPHLTGPVEVVDNLVLEGVLILAGS